MRGATRALLPCAALVLMATGCARKVIPNTDVPDTPENREVVEFVERYRKAVLQQDTGKLMALVSPQHLDDNGTPSGGDDLDYERLKKRLGALRQDIKDVRYDIRYRRVTYRDKKVLVDFTYSASFLVKTPSGERWARRLSDNRLVLLRENGEYLILSGI